MLPNVGGAELLVVLLVALLILGPDKLPGAARNVGKALGEIKRLSAGFQAEMRDAMQEPVSREPETEPEAPPEARRPRRARPLEAAPAELHEDDPTA